MKKRINNNLRVVMRCLLLLFACAVFAVQDEQSGSDVRIDIRGVTVTGDRYCPSAALDSSRCFATLQHVRSSGASWTALVSTWYQTNTAASAVFALPSALRFSSPVPGYWNYTLLSETRAAVTRAIRRARSLGLRVLLKPHIDVVHDEGGVWRGAVLAQSAQWWESYQRMLLLWARVAQREHVDMLSVGCELVAASQQEQRWRLLIAQIRAVYKGLLTYSANWAQAPFPGEVTLIRFWDALDYIGCDEYAPIPGTSLQEAEAAWQPYIDQLHALHRQYNKPVIFTELGYCTSDPCGPHGAATPAGIAAQAVRYEAALRVMLHNRSWLKGVFFWNWRTENARPPPCMDIRWSEAEQVMRRYFNATEPQPEPPNHTSTCRCIL